MLCLSIRSVGTYMLWVRMHLVSTACILTYMNIQHKGCLMCFLSVRFIEGSGTQSFEPGELFIFVGDLKRLGQEA